MASAPSWTELVISPAPGRKVGVSNSNSFPHPIAATTSNSPAVPCNWFQPSTTTTQGSNHSYTKYEARPMDPIHSATCLLHTRGAWSPPPLPVRPSIHPRSITLPLIRPNSTPRKQPPLPPAALSSPSSLTVIFAETTLSSFPCRWLDSLNPHPTESLRRSQPHPPFRVPFLCASL